MLSIHTELRQKNDIIGFWRGNCWCNTQVPYVPHPHLLLQWPPFSWSLIALLYHNTNLWNIASNELIQDLQFPASKQNRWHLTHPICFKSCMFDNCPEQIFLKAQMLVIWLYTAPFLLQHFSVFFITPTRSTTDCFGFLAALVSQDSVFKYWKT